MTARDNQDAGPRDRRPSSSIRVSRLGRPEPQLESARLILSGLAPAAKLRTSIPTQPPQPAGQPRPVRKGSLLQTFPLPKQGTQGPVHIQGCAPRLIPRIEHRLGMDFVRAKGDRLRGPTQWLGLTYGSQGSDRGVERRDAAAVEAPAVTMRVFAGQRRPGPLRVVRPVHRTPGNRITRPWNQAYLTAMIRSR